MNVYFLGIAGAGMSALATLMASEGHRVSGSDGAVYPPVSAYLERLGVPFYRGFDAAHVPGDLDLAIVGSSAALDLATNPELAELSRRGVPQLSFAEYLGRYSKERRTAVIAGSFGKSTLTALCAVLLDEAGLDPGYFIGAVPLDLATTGHAGTDPWSPARGRRIHRQSRGPALEVPALPSERPADQLAGPRPFQRLPDHGRLRGAVRPTDRRPARGRAAGLRPALRAAGAADGRPSAGWYGLGDGPGYGAEDIEIGEITRFSTCRTPSGERLPLETELLGLHNIENIAGAAALLVECGRRCSPSPGARACAGSGAWRGGWTRRPRPRASRPMKVSARPTRRPARPSSAIALHFPKRPAGGGVRAPHLQLAQRGGARLVRHGVQGRRPGPRPAAARARRGHPPCKLSQAEIAGPHPRRRASRRPPSTGGEAVIAALERGLRARRWFCCSRPDRWTAWPRACPPGSTGNSVRLPAAVHLDVAPRARDQEGRIALGGRAVAAHAIRQFPDAGEAGLQVLAESLSVGDDEARPGKIGPLGGVSKL